MLARRFPGPVLTARRRIEAVSAAEVLGCEAVVLDDGFQHRAIARDVDLVIVNDRGGPLLPAGPMRERLAALGRADAVVLAGDDSVAGLADSLRNKTGKPVYSMQLEPTGLVEAVGGWWQERPLGWLAGKQVVAVAGIAQPQRFFELLHAWDAVIDDVFAFPDHHPYTEGDWQRITRASRDSDLVVTTEKDLVKLEAFPFASGKLVALRIEPEIEEAEKLVEMVVGKLARSPRVDEWRVR
jgi:tetraacyldisaccharide 4'-kinase